jgi:hypothetical protein
MTGILAILLFFGLVGVLLWVLLNLVWKDRGIGS